MTRRSLYVAFIALVVGAHVASDVQLVDPLQGLLAAGAMFAVGTLAWQIGYDHATRDADQRKAKPTDAQAERIGYAVLDTATEIGLVSNHAVTATDPEARVIGYAALVAEHLPGRADREPRP